MKSVLAVLIGLCFLTGPAFGSEAEAPEGWLGVRMTTRAALAMALRMDRLPEEFMAIPTPDALVEQWDGKGVLVAQVIQETPAERAGLFPGDVVIELNGIRVDGPSTLAYLVRRAVPDRDATLAVLRDGERRELLFTVGTREGEPAGREQPEIRRGRDERKSQPDKAGEQP